ncbi:MAG: hypothetical protein N5P05_001063 [Chroococcopsis gigantea SAG 12.99]|jgi:hypothetical protein|nr:hypothetical protein [Chlorogloea purpurea SAG 13.99]MDV2999457.1 hypothetical protein [Chroococcopsis gigantea SAG 12.99]
MLTHHCLPVSLSLVSTDLPILATVETSATLYKKDQHWYHLLINQPPLTDEAIVETLNREKNHNQLLWLEISPYRVIMTMQGKGNIAYRHFWEQGVFGVSRFWLNAYNPDNTHSFRLRNYTRNLKVLGDSLPEYLRVEYELWSDKLQLGHYVLHVEIHH